MLPNLPEDEYQTDCNVEEDADNELSESLTKGSRKINNSFYI